MTCVCSFLLMTRLDLCSAVRFVLRKSLQITELVQYACMVCLFYAYIRRVDHPRSFAPRHASRSVCFAVKNDNATHDAIWSIGPSVFLNNLLMKIFLIGYP